MAAEIKRGKEMKIKVGSLFDGIGGAPLSAVLSGAEPVWASEIEKVPISITKRHFPNMKHYGDIAQINGAEIEPVDIIVGGSPCQDLSVAGKRAGLEGARSGLFMDQVRIVKEMRNATRRETSDRSTELPRPRYMVWENVPGAFSSNGGEDFRAVLEETAKVADPSVSIPRSVNGWANAGSILADRFSISWRTFDAQYWGVPQRRRRIYLVADFGGHTAPEILFEQESVSRDITEGGETGQRIATDAERSSGAAGESCVKSAGFIGTNGVKAHGIGYEEEKSPTLVAGRSNDVVIESIPVLNDQGGSVMGISYGVTGTLRAQEHGHQPIVAMNMGDNQAAVAFAQNQRGEVRDMKDKSGALQAQPGMNQQTFVLQGNMIGRADHNGPQGSGVNEDVSFTLNTVDRHAVCYGISSYHSNAMKSSNPNSGIYEADTSKTIDQNGGNPACNQGGIAICSSVGGFMQAETELTPTLMARDYKDPCIVSRQNKQVRRLTPLECERLQGYPDGWTALDHEDKPVSDSQRYKALGNSFAIPNALFVISRCVKQLQKEQVNEKD